MCGTAAVSSEHLVLMPQYLSLHILFIVLTLTADDMAVLHVGAMAEVCELVNHWTHNGELVTLISFDELSGRWSVEFADGVQHNIAPKNLKETVHRSIFLHLFSFANTYCPRQSILTSPRTGIRIARLACRHRRR